MSKEYIERVNALQSIDEHLHFMLDDAPISDTTKEIYSMAYRHVADVIKAIPAADVVEVVWLPVVGYEGLYEVSNLGDVKAADGTLLRQTISHKKNTDYKTVWLKKNGTGRTVYVHRIVANAFIPNPSNLPIVNHKDEDGTNNKAENLEWCTMQYNATYGTAIERRVAKIRGRKMSEKQKHDISASVKKYQNSEAGYGKRIVCLETNQEFTSIRAAAEHFGLNPSTVGMCCLRGTNGRKYTFRYCAKMDGGADDAAD